VCSSDLTGVKFATAAGAEVYKGSADGKGVVSIATTSLASGVLNATGVIGKVASATAEKLGLTKTLDRNVAALLQPKPSTPAAASLTEKALGSPVDVAAGVGADYLGDVLGGGESPKGNQSLQAMTKPDATAGRMFANPDSLCIVCTNNYSSGGFSNQGGKARF
jgi:hypothetical protein